MNLKFKKPSKETQLAMSEVAGGKNRDIDYQKIAQEKLAGMTNHKFSKLLSSGNAAIFTAMNAIDGAIMIPDQGAWNGFKQIARFLNKDLIVVKTDKGLITQEYLSEILNSSSNIGALFLTSFAAYTAEQDISGISDFLREKDIMLVEDASGAIGDDILADGKYSDIIIGSTGSPKIVNVEDGGFNSVFIQGLNDRVDYTGFLDTHIIEHQRFFSAQLFDIDAEPSGLAYSENRAGHKKGKIMKHFFPPR